MGEGGESSEANAKEGISFRKLFCFADIYDYVLMIIGTAGAVGHGASLPIFFVFLGGLVNGFGSNEDNASEMANIVSKYTLYLVYLGGVAFVSSWAEVACWMHSGERQAARMRYMYLEAILKRDMSFYDSDVRTGKIVDSISADTLLFQDAISEKVGTFIRFLATFLAGFGVGFSTVWRVGLVSIAALPMMVIVGGLYAYTLAGLTSQSHKAYEGAGIIAQESIEQVRTVYSFVGESRAIKTYSEALEGTLKLGYRGGLAKGASMGVTYGVMFCSYSLVLWYSGVLVRNGIAPAGKCITAIFSVMTGGIALGGCFSNLGAFAKGKAAGYKIMQMINTEYSEDYNRRTDGIKLTQVRGEIEMKNVDFSYPSRPDVMVLRNFCLQISVGKTVAIVGSSGSGKSTVVSLIERFYEPAKGEVLLDGHDISTLHLKWLRDQIGLVNQEPVLFATSILDNILYGNGSATMEEVVEAAKAANAHAFISDLPDGYETLTGERGVQLSGGQKQRVAIARAVLKNPKILLLDEATSALDSSSERLVQAALDLIMVGRTTVVIAHRLSTIRNVDTIAVVHQGCIVEMGNHQELISKGETGAYASLVRLQEMAIVEDEENYSEGPRLSRSISSNSRTGSSKRRFDRLSSHGSDRKVEAFAVPIDEMDPKSQKSCFWRLAKMSLSEWRCAIPGCLGSVLSGFLVPIFSLLVGQTLKSYFYKDNGLMERRIREFALLFVGVGFLHPIDLVLSIFSSNEANFAAAILRNEVGWFDREENNSSQITSRLASDSTTVKSAVVERISLLVQNFGALVTAFTLAFIIQWRIAFVVLATFPLLVGAGFAENLSLKGFAGDQAKAHSRATAVAGEAVSNIRTVAAFNAEDKVLLSFRDKLRHTQKRAFRRGQISGFFFGLSQMSVFSSYGLGFWYGSRLIKNGTSEFGEVIRVFLIIMYAAMNVAESLSLTPDMVKGGHALRSVFNVLDRKTCIDPDDAGAEKLETVKGDLELKRVQFFYPTRPHATVLKDLSIAVRAGQSLALVGGSGSGKSSVIALIMRFYDPVLGKVMVDGKDIREVNLKSLRLHIGLVQQEPSLFATSIRENIAYGKESSCEEDIIGAAKAANAHEFISALPDGYNTLVGERGMQLSGGQKQRVAIARAVLKNPSILLLDEATSALDSESEKVVQEALDRLMIGRTAVIVAHRLSTIRNVNCIAVLENGKIVEHGSHYQLISQPDTVYSRLQSMQLLSTPQQI
eukprot:Gb_35777 [translate_table: standard]